jgi:hypothetical protein
VRRWLWSSFALLAAGCGGSSPTLPAPPVTTPPPALVVRNGWDEAPVSAEISPVNPAVGTFATVRAPGFLVRDATFTGQPFYLWPQDPEYVRAMVYSEYVPAQRMTRWQDAFTVEAIEGVAGDVLTDAVAEVVAATGLPITVASTGSVRLTIDPDDPHLRPGTAAVTYNTFRGNTILGARVVFRSLDHLTGRGRLYDNLVLHELGHVLGLGHSPHPRDVMRFEADRTDERTFSEQERVALKLMYRWRQAGNVFPDSAPAPGILSARERTIVIVD